MFIPVWLPLNEMQTMIYLLDPPQLLADYPYSSSRDWRLPQLCSPDTCCFDLTGLFLVFWGGISLWHVLLVHHG